jgi:hypothetical protein
MDQEPVTDWLLRHTPKNVRKLEKEGLLLLVKNPRLIPDMKLIVPEGISVYEAIGNYRCAGQIFFTAREDNDMQPAYASVIWGQEIKEGLNYARNVGKLLDYSWFSVQDSRFIFSRLVRLSGNAPIYGRTPMNQANPHPLKVLRN